MGDLWITFDQVSLPTLTGPHHPALRVSQQPLDNENKAAILMLMGVMTYQERYSLLAGSIIANGKEVNLEQLLIDAYEEGFDQGCAEGRSAGYQEAVQDLDERWE